MTRHIRTCNLCRYEQQPTPAAQEICLGMPVCCYPMGARICLEVGQRRTAQHGTAGLGMAGIVTDSNNQMLIVYHTAMIVGHDSLSHHLVTSFFLLDWCDKITSFQKTNPKDLSEMSGLFIGFTKDQALPKNWHETPIYRLVGIVTFHWTATIPAYKDVHLFCHWSQWMVHIFVLR